MDEDALLAMGTILAALGGILERKGVCTTHELAETLGGVAFMTQEAGKEYERRAAYIGSMAHMVRAAAHGAGRANQN
jgi:hypothetical protein